MLAASTTICGRRLEDNNDGVIGMEDINAEITKLLLEEQTKICCWNSTEANNFDKAENKKRPKASHDKAICLSGDNKSSTMMSQKQPQTTQQIPPTPLPFPSTNTNTISTDYTLVCPQYPPPTLS